MPTTNGTLRRFRRQRNATQKDLARICGTTQSRISRVEAGKARLNTDEIASLLAFFQCAPSDLGFKAVVGFAPITEDPCKA